MDYKDFVLQHTQSKLDFWHKARLLLIDSLMRSQQFAADAIILDVGSGTGTEVPLLQNYGKVIALDTEPRALEEAKKFGCETLLCDIAKTPLPPAAYDAVGCFDVLEHIYDDKAALQNIYQSLKPGSFLFITVPAYQWLFSEHDRALDHHRRYSRNDLLAKLRAAGFSVAYVRYWNSLLFPLVVIVRLFKKITGEAGSDAPVSEMQPVSPMADKLLYYVLAQESSGPVSHLVSWLPFGVSLAITARKP